MAFHVRPILPGDIQPAAALVARVFQTAVAPLYGEAGINTFMAYAAAPEALAERLRGDHLAHVATDETGVIVGMIEVRAHNHISLLFVETALQRQGTGRALLEAVIADCQATGPGASTLTVNAAPNSMPAYEKFGFVATEPEQEKDGIRFIPMTLTLRKVAA